MRTRRRHRHGIELDPPARRRRRRGGRVHRADARDAHHPPRPGRRRDGRARPRGDRARPGRARRLPRGDRSARRRANHRRRDERRARRGQRRRSSWPRCASGSASTRASCPATRRRRLTFLGATAGPPGRRATPALVLDIGGGSTEFVDRRARRAARLPRLDPGRRRPPDRAPRHRRPAAARGAAGARGRGARRSSRPPCPRICARSTAAGIAVAGTATSVAAIDQELDPYDPERVHGYELQLAACERVLAMLAALPEAERREVTGLHPDRAPTIVAGVVDTHRGDARLRSGGHGDERGGHPPRRRAVIHFGAIWT